MVKMSDRPHLSDTQIEMYARCPEQYRRRYICGDIVPPGIPLVFGSSYHDAARANFEQKIETRLDLPARDIQEIASEAFKARLADGYTLSEEEAEIGKEWVLGRATVDLALVAEAHALSQAPDYQPVAVEHTTRIEFPEASHDLVAVTDLRDDRGRVVDLKTAAKKPPAGLADASLQLTIYAAAYLVDTGEDASEVRLDTITKTARPARHVDTSQRTDRDYDALISRVNAMLGTLAAFEESGLEPWPAAPVGPSAWWCSSAHCGYWWTCPHVNSERRAAAGRG